MQFNIKSAQVCTMYILICRTYIAPNLCYDFLKPDFLPITRLSSNSRDKRKRKYISTPSTVINSYHSERYTYLYVAGSAQHMQAWTSSKCWHVLVSISISISKYNDINFFYNSYFFRFLKFLHFGLGANLKESPFQTVKRMYSACHHIWHACTYIHYI